MQERIAYLFERYTSRTCTREELEELFSYIGKDENRALLEQIIDDTRSEQLNAPDLDYANIYRQIAPEKRGFWRPLAVAATVLLMAGTAYYYLAPQKQKNTTLVAKQTVNKVVLTLADGSTIPLDSNGSKVITPGIRQQNGQLLYTGTNGALHYNKLSTPRGGQFQLVLPDGTKVWLNSASTLRYPTAFTGKERTVELDGQGYFEVAVNPAQPFTVKANKVEVQVLGTGFDVMAYSDESTVNTTLVNGSVKVNEQKLLPGQQAVVNNQDQSITVRTADLKKVIAWKNGLFVFNNMALPAILREVARWYDVEIVYTTRPGEELYGGGISRNLQLADVLKLLEDNGHNHFKTEGRKIIVLP